MKESIIKGKILSNTMAKKNDENGFDDGYSLGDELVKEWNSQPNPPKVYINSYRIHHGLVGLILTVGGGLGLVLSDRSGDEKTRDLSKELSSVAMGLGTRLIEDDMADMPKWFNFEKNNSSPHTQYQSSTDSRYDEFA